MSPTRVAYGADDENETTRAVLAHLAARGDEVVDVTGDRRGPTSARPSAGPSSTAPPTSAW